MDGNGWLGVLGGGGFTGLVGVLYWVLRRTERAQDRSNSALGISQQAMRYTGSNLALVEALRQAIYKQGESLDLWEDWGVDIKREWKRLQRELKEHGMISEIHELPEPPPHLDLSPLFKNLPSLNLNDPPIPQPGHRDDSPGGIFDRFLHPPESKGGA